MPSAPLFKANFRAADRDRVLRHHHRDEGIDLGVQVLGLAHPVDEKVGSGSV
jgi:hypothetical protein